ncbi:MAG: hypothetical protein QM744_04345, partial [Mesorhizobium sp.]
SDDQLQAKAPKSQQAGPPAQLRRELESYKNIPDAPIDESAGLPPELSTGEAVGAFAEGAAKGLATGIAFEFE